VTTSVLDDFCPDPHSDVPPFRQLRRRIAADIASGRLSKGEKLPSVRALAATLNMAPNTVAKVYKELEAESLVATAGRAGTVVTGTGVGTGKVHDAAARLAREARRVGMDDEAVLAVVRAALTTGE
jgi:DNA-binding transcriptional regulator YhcF (GntR family)